MRILGVDPGLRTTGWGVVEVSERDLLIIEAGVLRSRSVDPLSIRLKFIHDGLAEVILRLRPDRVAVESIFHARNSRSSLLLGHVRGVILLAASMASLPVMAYSPREVKKAVTGFGAAEKRQVQEMVRILLCLETLPRPADKADALAVAICHANCLRGPRIPGRRVR